MVVVVVVGDSSDISHLQGFNIHESFVRRARHSTSLDRTQETLMIPTKKVQTTGALWHHQRHQRLAATGGLLTYHLGIVNRRNPT